MHSTVRLRASRPKLLRHGRWSSPSTAGPADGSYRFHQQMPIPLAIAVAGALGALARYGLDGVIARRVPGAFPCGTFVINVSGSFLLGLALTLEKFA